MDKGIKIERDDIALQLLEPGDVVESPRGGVTILRVERDALLVRPEQPADMWCEGGKPPKIKPAREIRLTGDTLYSKMGHLLVHFKYTRGC